MNVIIVGAGKLAKELLESLGTGGAHPVFPWAERDRASGKSIVVHAGSGRELDEVVAYCRATRSPLMELSTGSRVEAMTPDFPLVLCPNTNILMLKFMAMLARNGAMFEGYPIAFTESHQAQKSSTPGTAVAMAQSLGLPAAEIVSIRNPAEQQGSLGIPPEHLGRHAYHRIVIEDGLCSLALETRVYGATPYADGVARIVSAIAARQLDNRRYDIIEFVDNGWI
ncbi:MAG TPA: dihydrodipicolinate reductase [Rhodocyclaceae bacterium]|nr:dihydrodipicolinate reductase [Rhodocyclaceae bacterium]